MVDTKFRPFLIKKDDDGNYRLTVRSVRYNSQGYALVDSALQVETFKNAAAARTYVRDMFGAQAGQYTTK